MTNKASIEYVDLINKSGLSIYDAVPPELFIPTPILQTILRTKLIGISTAGMANRTRSKFVKEQIAAALGYPCLLYTSPSPRDRQKSRMPSSA